ncbi:acyltransferase [Mucilaginibacter sabulilitoris]|uniref:Acyltransferase n=1 Tax=Mucilaginibacter sabulilitoris TaxID=1173583 RepID=A0ABZ0TEN5_9SPHI|nr:acyltransferase [Mucilaginibacter sabulilitoris]WPU91652.1 acyltransferase [Mucilaginibacter sabulilitoris]
MNISASNPQKHNPVIDMLRFFAAFMVFVFHLNTFVPPAANWYRSVVKYGWLGVPVFFVISGYCILLSADSAENGQAFLRKRFFRIFPAYWVSLIIVLVAALFQKIYTGTNSVANIPRNALQLAGTLSLFTWPFNHIKITNWVYWTLTCELLFYLLISLLFLVRNKYRIFALIIISLISVELPHQNEGYLFFFDHWSTFCCGISLFFFFRNATRSDWLYWSLFSGINAYNLVIKNFQVQKNEYTIAALLTILIIAFSHYSKPSKNILATLGLYSYSLYLIHVPIGVFILGYYKSQAVVRSTFLTVAFDLAAYFLITLVAAFMFKFVEKPCIDYGRKRTKMQTNHVGT